WHLIFVSDDLADDGAGGGDPLAPRAALVRRRPRSFAPGVARHEGLHARAAGDLYGHAGGSRTCRLRRGLQRAAGAYLDRLGHPVAVHQLWPYIAVSQPRCARHRPERAAVPAQVPVLIRSRVRAFARSFRSRVVRALARWRVGAFIGLSFERWE